MIVFHNNSFFLSSACPTGCELCSYSGTEMVCDDCQSTYTVINALKCVGKLTLKVLVKTIDAQWEGMGDVGSARYEPALLPPCPTIRVLSYSN